MESISLGGFNGAYFPAKENPAPVPVLFIHGAFTDHSRFNKLAFQFANKGYNSYALSRRGRSGHLPRYASGLTFDDYLQDTLSIIREIQPTPILVGHSLGGLLAMKAAEANPNIPALILINSAPPAMLTPPPLALPYFFALLPKIFLGKPFKPPLVAFEKFVLNMVDENEKASIANTFVHESGIIYRQMMLGQIRLNANGITVPAFVIGSSNDRIISKRHNKITVRKTNAAFKEYDNHGHWIIEEEGVEQLATDIIDWLNRMVE